MVYNFGSVYMVSETLTADRGYIVSPYSMVSVAYTQQILDMDDLFGTSAN